MKIQYDSPNLRRIANLLPLFLSSRNLQHVGVFAFTYITSTWYLGICQHGNIHDGQQIMWGSWHVGIVIQLFQMKIQYKTHKKSITFILILPQPSTCRRVCLHICHFYLIFRYMSAWQYPWWTTNYVGQSACQHSHPTLPNENSIQTSSHRQEVFLLFPYTYT